MGNKGVEYQGFGNYEQGKIQKRNVSPRNVKRTIRGANNRPVSGKAYKDEKKGNLKGVLIKTAATLLAGSILGGVGYTVKSGIEDHETYTSHREKIIDSISNDYYDSMYLRENVVFEDYVEAVEAELDVVIAETPGMKEYITDTTSNNWAEIGYLCLGEGYRDDIQDNSLFQTMVDYNSYVDERLDGKVDGEDNFITQVCDLASKCTTDSNKGYVVKIVDATQGAKSISNSKTAIEYQIGLNNERIQGIERTDNIEGLEDRIYTNSNFLNLLVNEKDEWTKNSLIKTIGNFYNSRVQTANEFTESESLPETYREVFSKYGDAPTWSSIVKNFDVPDIGHIKETMDLTGIATYDAFNKFTDGRNDLYEQILEDKSNSKEAVDRLNIENVILSGRVEDQKTIESKDMNEFLTSLEEVYELHDEYEKLNESHYSATPGHGVGRDSGGPEH